MRLGFWRSQNKKMKTRGSLAFPCCPSNQQDQPLPTRTIDKQQQQRGRGQQRNNKSGHGEKKKAQKIGRNPSKNKRFKILPDCVHPRTTPCHNLSRRWRNTMLQRVVRFPSPPKHGLQAAGRHQARPTPPCKVPSTRT